MTRNKQLELWCEFNNIEIQREPSNIRLIARSRSNHPIHFVLVDKKESEGEEDERLFDACNRMAADLCLLEPRVAMLFSKTR